jgi:uncharacterized protein YpmS
MQQPPFIVLTKFQSAAISYFFILFKMFRVLLLASFVVITVCCRLQYKKENTDVTMDENRLRARVEFQLTSKKGNLSQGEF